jgi:peptidyl-dipeptidase A
MPQASFQQFLDEFIPEVARKSRQGNQALWLLETTGSNDAAALKGDLDTELRVLFSNPHQYQKLVAWGKEGKVKDPLLKRQLHVLLRAFQANQIEKPLLEKISQKEAQLSQTYGSFRPLLNGKPVSENEIRDVLKKEKNVEKRKQAWEASKSIGAVLAPQILEIVALRNQAAKTLGFSDYFQMQLQLQDVDGPWLLKTFETLSQKSDAAYRQVRSEIDQVLSKRFNVPTKELGPWAWSDPFCQEDPLDSFDLDGLVDGVDLVETSRAFYERLGMDVKEIVAKSDMWERPGKNQHAFCIHMDKEGDIRTLNNVKPSLKWLETVLHELGHAIYEVGLSPKLPWLLKEPPHMITTEAMALLAGRQAYKKSALQTLVGSKKPHLLDQADSSLRRRQLIFSRWVLVMTAFESELYRDPSQDLNGLWWKLVEKHQHISTPAGRKGQFDWACKYHMGLAPVYYFSYLLGELFASAIQKVLPADALDAPESGRFLQEKLFGPGSRLSWDELICHVTGHPLSMDPWLDEFCC